MSSITAQPADPSVHIQTSRRVPPGRDGVLTIEFKRPTDTSDGYIGAHSLYAPLDDESWERGNDLSDGPYSEETVEQIVEAIRAVFRGERA